MRCVAAFSLLVWTLGSVAPVSATEAVPDSAITEPTGTDRAWFVGPFDTIDAEEYAGPRSFSLDQFLQSLSGYVIERFGPIGAFASYSRYGIGRARGAVYLGGVPLNDPQDGRAPLALVPVSSIRQLGFGASGGRYVAGQAGIEGLIQIVEPRELPREPTVMIDVGKGDHRLKQRRAMYSSPRKPAGIDFGYDELRDGGYAFDARGLVNGTDYGSSATRMSDAELRGVLANGEAYRFALKRFQTSLLGDTLEDFSDNTRHGYIASMETSVDAFQLTVFGRSYTVSTRDSVTMNQTTSIALTAPLDGDSRRVVVSAGYEDVLARQEIAGASAGDRLQTAWASAATASMLSGNTMIEIAADMSHQFARAWAWGARAAVVRRVGEVHRVIAEVRRGYRLPNVGELFLPLHRVGESTTDAVGNRDLKSESSLEASLKWISMAGPLRNELQATAIRIQDPILPVAVAQLPTALIQPANTDAQGVQIIEDRLSVRTSYRGIELQVSGGVMVAAGSRDRYFEGVPETRVVAAASLGRSLFKNTSHILVGGELEYSGPRTAGGPRLDPYNVVNFKLEGRLVDAHIYLSWLNAFDEVYETQWPYLMTPQTVAYGIAWTLYN